MPYIHEKLDANITAFHNITILRSDVGCIFFFQRMWRKK